MNVTTAPWFHRSSRDPAASCAGGAPRTDPRPQAENAPPTADRRPGSPRGGADGILLK